MVSLRLRLLENTVRIYQPVGNRKPYIFNTDMTSLPYLLEIVRFLTGSNRFSCFPLRVTYNEANDSREFCNEATKRHPTECATRWKAKTRPTEQARCADRRRTCKAIP